MYLRCTDCLTSTWVDVVQEDRLVDAVDCGACGRRCILAPIEELDNSVRAHYRRALDFANQHDMDMASAYSVLLGIMSREQAEVLRHSSVCATPPPPPDDPVLQLEAEAKAEVAAEGESQDAAREPGVQSSARVKRHAPVERLPLIPDFDLGFTKAIARGHLTVQQAMTRGERNAFASRLGRRHRLSKELAYDVTDNRLSLRDALRRNEKAQKVSPLARLDADDETRASIAPAQAVAVLCLAVAILTFVTWRAWSEHFVTERDPIRTMSVGTPPAGPNDGAPPTARPASKSDPLLAATGVRKDSLGRVLEVTGPDPKSVLIAYCEASESILGLSPLEITGTVPRFRNARLGLFRDLGALDSVYAIRIRKDASTGRWSAGGTSDAPIPVRPAPHLPPDVVRIPVSSL
jgi:hypothetical protein